jgi:hypothetical protein
MKDAMAPQDNRNPPAAPPSQQETGKFRASRIPLDYYKHTDRLDRWRRRLLGLAVLLGVGWGGLTLLRGDAGRMTFSRGPVAAVHATWENQCQVCHVSMTAPIGSETRWLPAWFTEKTHTTDQQCQACHLGAVHHANQKAEDIASCAGCHHDHRGRDASLTRVPDKDCTNCHQNLRDHTNLAVPSDFAVANFSNVTRFDTDHPNFRAVQTPRPPGRLKFNHKVHMTPGMDCQFTLEGIAAIDPANKGRYEAVPDANGKMVVKLECASCHQADSYDFAKDYRDKLRGLPADLVFPPRSVGAYMVPITYENQCAACHPLTFAKDPDKHDGAYAAIPHRLQPLEVRQYLKDFYTRQYLNGNNQLLERDFQPQRMWPGRQPDPETKKVGETIQRMVDASARILLDKASKNTCSECHTYQGDPVKDDGSKIVPPNVNPIWFKQAVFNHAAHRAVTCNECHPRATDSDKSEDVLIPGKDVCTACHSPPGRTAEGLRGGARFDCVECHRYHNGRDSLQGIGAAARGARDRYDTQRFLSGPD